MRINIGGGGGVDDAVETEFSKGVVEVDNLTKIKQSTGIGLISVRAYCASEA